LFGFCWRKNKNKSLARRRLIAKHFSNASGAVFYVICLNHFWLEWQGSMHNFCRFSLAYLFI